MTDKLRYAGYIRVSSQQQLDGFSLDAQKRAITDFVKAQGGKLVELYVDGGASARTMKRDAFQQMRSDAGKHKFDVLVVHKFDRLNRNNLDATMIKVLLRRDYNLKIVSVTEAPEDTGTPAAMFQEIILQGMAEYFSRNLGAEVKKGKRESAEQGLYSGAVRPFGYARNKNVLTPHEVEAPIIQMMFNDYSTGDYSFQSLADKLNGMGLRTSKNTLWKRENTRFILRNIIYTGKLSYRDTTYTSDNKRKLSKPVIYDGKHEPLVSQELFDKCQLIATRKRKNVSANPVQGEYLLSGLCHCGDCEVGEPPEGVPLPKWGRMLVSRAPHSNPDMPEYQYYRCRHKHGAARTADIDQQVINFLLSDDLPEEWKKNAVFPMWEGIQERSTEERIAEIRGIIERMDYRFDQGFITNRDEYLQKRQELQAAWDELEPLKDDSYDRAVEMVYNIRKYWDLADGDLHKQRELVKNLVERVYIQDGRVVMVVLKPGYRHVMLQNGISDSVVQESVLRYESSPEYAAV